MKRLFYRIVYWLRFLFYRIVLIERYIGRRFIEFMRIALKRSFLVFREFIAVSVDYSRVTFDIVKYLKFLFVWDNKKWFIINLVSLLFIYRFIFHMFYLVLVLLACVIHLSYLLLLVFTISILYSILEIDIESRLRERVDELFEAIEIICYFRFTRRNIPVSEQLKKVTLQEMPEYWYIFDEVERRTNLIENTWRYYILVAYNFLLRKWKSRHRSMFSYYLDWRLSRIQFFSLTQFTFKIILKISTALSYIIPLPFKWAYRIIRFTFRTLKYYLAVTIAVLLHMLCETIRLFRRIYVYFKIKVKLWYVFHMFFLRTLWLCHKYQKSEHSSIESLNSDPFLEQYLDWFSDYLMQHNYHVLFFRLKLKIDEQNRKNNFKVVSKIDSSIYEGEDWIFKLPRHKVKKDLMLLIREIIGEKFEWNNEYRDIKFDVAAKQRLNIWNVIIALFIPFFIRSIYLILFYFLMGLIRVIPYTLGLLWIIISGIPEVFLCTIKRIIRFIKYWV